jgi:type 1 glutamine amidotransferase
MNQYYKLLLAAICLSLLMNSLLLSQKELPKPSQEEIVKIQEAMPNKAIVEPNKPRKLLVFNLCGPGGFRHTSIPYWNKALELMAQKTGAFSVVVSSDMDIFKAENLKQFDAVCFNNTTNLPFDPEKTPELCQGLMDFVKGGKGIIGIHAATDNFNQWPEAQEMMGGKFTGHPWGASGTWAIKIDEPNHPLTVPFAGKGFKIKDEIYRTEPPLYSRDKQLVLMSLDMSDEATREKSEKPTDADTGISWIKTWGKGRVFYCSLGHNHDVTWNPAVLEHYLRGIQFALGDLKIDTKPKQKTPQ